jgi:hypothetical protein
MQADDGAGMSGEHVSLTPQELHQLLHEGEREECSGCVGGDEQKEGRGPFFERRRKALASSLAPCLL